MSDVPRESGFARAPNAIDAYTPRRRWVPSCGMARGAFGRPLRFARPSAARAGSEDRFEWVIVGGGIHGTYLAQFILRALGTPADKIRLVDRYEEPLHRWKRLTANVGMEYLRSAAVHHLDLASLSLKRFRLEEHERQRLAAPPLLPPYGRPALVLFNRHAESVIRRYRIDELTVKGEVRELKASSGGYELATETTVLRSRRVLLAIGASDQPCWPAWAIELRAAGAPIYHVLDPSFDRRQLPAWRSAVVWGGGLSAAQLAVALAKERPGAVTLVTHHDLRVHLFDSEPSWQGQNFMRSFALEPSPVVRRAIIERERHRGSLTPEAKAELEREVSAGRIHLVQLDGEPTAERHGRLLRFRRGGTCIRGEIAILATGYDRRRPGGEWLDRTIKRLRLPLAPCGYPIVDPSLQWREGLFVSGPLAELELGPVARNISGAHRTGARLEYYLSPRS